MDVYRNSAVCGDIPAEFQPETVPSPAKPLWEDFFPEQNKEGDEENISLQWLSTFVEDCLSAGTACFTSPPPLTLTNTAKTCATSQILLQSENPNPSSFQGPSPPAKARRTKRRNTEADANFLNCSADSPLLHQKHWLAESELLIIPKMEKVDKIQKKASGDKRQLLKQPPPPPPPKRCSHCLSQRTPQWRAGPLGPKTLCNACGVRFKSGRLLPEYRPAKSPTFVSYKHSNSHRKVMEMRMAVLPPNSK